MTIHINLKKPQIIILKFMTTGEYCLKIINYVKKVRKLIPMELKICKE